MRVGLFSLPFTPEEGGQGRSFFEIFHRLQNHPDLEIHGYSPHDLPSPLHHRTFGFLRRTFLGQLAYSGLVNLRIAAIQERDRLDILAFNGGPGGVLLLRRPPAKTIFWANHTYSQQARLVRGQAWKNLLVPLERRGYRMADRIVAISDSTRLELEEYYGIDPRKIKVLPVGVDTESFRPLDIERIPRSILFVGRLDTRKGIDFLTCALAPLATRVPDFRLFLRGEGPARSRIERTLEEEGLRENVRFLPSLSEPELVTWYNRCQVVVVPSIFEGFGIVASEAFACGTPVVATRCDGLSEIIEDGRNGFLVPYGDQEALASRLADLLTEPERWATVRAEARRTAEERFSWSSILPELERFICDLGRNDMHG